MSEIQTPLTDAKDDLIAELPDHERVRELRKFARDLELKLAEAEKARDEATKPIEAFRALLDGISDDDPTLIKLEKMLGALEKAQDEQVDSLRAENEKLRNFCICAYCKTELPKNTDAVMLHMQECEKHPLGDALRSEVALKEQLAKCETEWGQMAKAADEQVASLTQKLTTQTAAAQAMEDALKDLGDALLGRRDATYDTGMKRAFETAASMARNALAKAKEAK